MPAGSAPLGWWFNPSNGSKWWFSTVRAAERPLAARKRRIWFLLQLSLLWQVEMTLIFCCSDSIVVCRRAGERSLRSLVCQQIKSNQWNQIPRLRLRLGPLSLSGFKSWSAPGAGKRANRARHSFYCCNLFITSAAAVCVAKRTPLCRRRIDW